MYSDTGCTMLNWQDAANVLVSHSLPYDRNEVSIVYRCDKKNKRGPPLKVSRPNVIYLYNIGMNGIDKGDQLISYANHHFKNRR